MRFRTGSALGATVCAALLGYGYYLQFKGLEPCPLCMVQRGFFYVVMALFIIAAVHKKQLRADIDPDVLVGAILSPILMKFFATVELPDKAFADKVLDLLNDESRSLQDITAAPNEGLTDHQITDDAQHFEDHWLSWGDIGQPDLLGEYSALA